MTTNAHDDATYPHAAGPHSTETQYPPMPSPRGQGAWTDHHLDPRVIARVEQHQTAAAEDLRRRTAKLLVERVTRLTTSGALTSTVADAATTVLQTPLGSNAWTLEPGFAATMNAAGAERHLNGPPALTMAATDWQETYGALPERWALTVHRDSGPSVHQFDNLGIVTAFTIARYYDTQAGQHAQSKDHPDPDVDTAYTVAANTYREIEQPLAQWSTLATARQVLRSPLIEASTAAAGTGRDNPELAQAARDLNDELNRIDRAMYALEAPLAQVLRDARKAYSDVDYALAAYRARADRTAAAAEQDAIENARAALAAVRPVTVNLPARKEADAPEKAASKKTKKGKKAAEGRTLD
jgi:hypothetical protein